MKFVSIIIPYYKKRNYIKETLLSVLKQTYKNFEVIIVYDDPKKNDLNYILKFKQLDSRIKIIINKKNLGAGESRNLGIKRSKGYFIAFLDSDDLWKKNKLSKQIKFMEKKKIEFSFTTYDIINSKNFIIEKRIANKNLKYNDLIKSCDLGLSTVILNRKLIDHKTKFANLKTKEDYVLWLKISKKKTLYALNQNLTKWRRLDSSLSSDTLQKLIDGFRVYRKYLKFSFFKSIFYLLILSYNYFLKRVI
tara:strand:- start:43 stop:789 length:747 start_codon:yes stop_codon:yes gene_type:complete